MLKPLWWNVDGDDDVEDDDVDSEWEKIEFMNQWML